MVIDSFQIHAMNTLVEVEGPGFMNYEDLCQEITWWYNTFENVCSRFRDNSELSKLNAAPIDQVIQLHPTLFEILKKAMDYAQYTDFYFNPFIGRAIKELGYDATFDEVKKRTNSPFHSYTFEKFNFKNPIELLPTINAVIKKTNEDVDLGGIAKGWSVDKVGGILRSLGMIEGIVNAGGDLIVWGETERTIGVAHPKSDEQDIIQFTITNGAVATSNTFYRSWFNGEERVHHILNGKTAESTQTDVIQATALALSTTEADVIAKILCMLPFNEGIKWLEKYFPQAACIICKDDGTVAISQNAKNYIRKLVM